MGKRKEVRRAGESGKEREGKVRQEKREGDSQILSPSVNDIHYRQLLPIQ